jgi:hypothetical protein
MKNKIETTLNSKDSQKADKRLELKRHQAGFQSFQI